MVFQKNLTPLTKKGTVTKHKGKGSQMADMPNRQVISGLARNPATQSINDYSKATPMPQSTPTSAPDGLGTGNWPGIGQ